MERPDVKSDIRPVRLRCQHGFVIMIQFHCYLAETRARLTSFYHAVMLSQLCIYQELILIL